MPVSIALPAFFTINPGAQSFIPLRSSSSPFCCFPAVGGRWGWGHAAFAPSRSPLMLRVHPPSPPISPKNRGWQSRKHIITRLGPGFPPVWVVPFVLGAFFIRCHGVPTTRDVGACEAAGSAVRCHPAPEGASFRYFFNSY